MRVWLDRCRINTIGSENANSVGDLLNYSPICRPSELPVLSPSQQFNNAAARSNIELYRVDLGELFVLFPERRMKP